MKYLLLVGICWAALHGLELDEFIQKTVEYYDNLKTLTAEFEMITCDEMTGTCQLAKGNMYYARPSAFRLEFHDPDMYYIGDSAVLWIYVPAQKKAVKQNMESMPWQIRPASFLKEFGTRYRAEEQSNDGHSVVVRLIPVDENDFYDYVELVIQRSSHLIRKIVIVDKGGSERRITFDNLKTNKKISRSIFAFKPPADTQIDEF